MTTTVNEPDRINDIIKEYNEVKTVTSEDELNWDSIVSKKGETRVGHVNKHGVNNTSREYHTIINEDPISITNNAWKIKNSATPVDDGMGCSIYNIPYKNSGYEGGMNGTGNQPNYVTVVVEKGTNKLITAFSSGWD